MKTLTLDHIALSATHLSGGMDHIEAALSVDMASGGEHPTMGTHNRLLGLGPDIYLETIAINPDAPRPAHPRWFNLDHFAGAPRLTNWILRTDDIKATLAQLGADFGTPISLQRGDFRWHMAVPASGVLPWGGWGPAIIQWYGAHHPAPILPDTGVRLTSLTLAHPQAQIMQATLGALMAENTIQFETAATPSLSAQLETPSGLKTLN